MSLFGMFMAARTLTALSRRGSVTQNNLANQSTQGFKFDRIIAAFDPASGAPTLSRATDMGQGALLRTDNPFDMALQGPGFFVIETPNGERLTRNGGFQVLNGKLVDDAQRPVLGENGSISIDGTDVVLHADGTIMVDGKYVDRIRIVSAPNNADLVKEGIGLFQINGPLGSVSVAETQLVQGHVEESNMNAMAGIGDMIDIQRNFALTMGALRTMDSMLETVTNQVGRP